MDDSEGSGGDGATAPVTSMPGTGAPGSPTLPPDLGLTWRPMSSADAPALSELVSAIETADAPPYRTALSEVADMFEGDWKDPARDMVVGIDEAGTFRAYGSVECPPGDTTVRRAFLLGGVHPEVRGAGLGRAVLAWMTERARAKLAETESNLPGRIAAFLDDSAPEHWRLYEAAGYQANRFYSNLRRDLSAPVPTPPLAAELRVVPWDESLDDAARLAHNDAFRDHWGSEPATPESWVQGRSMFAPAWSFVVLDDTVPEKQRPFVAGYLMSGRYEQDWPVTGHSSGYVETLGVRRAYRGRKIAVSLLTQAMRTYAAEGVEYAELDVDADNPSGAYGLYSALGFERTSGSRMYSIEL